MTPTLYAPIQRDGIILNHAEENGLGYVFQDTRLFPHLTVAQNLRYADKRARGRPGPSLADITSALDLAPPAVAPPAQPVWGASHHARPSGAPC